MDYIYQARFEADPDGGFLVTFPDVPEAITHGEDIAEARHNAGEALGLALRGLLQAGRPLPSASPIDDPATAIGVPADAALKLATVEAFRSSGLTKSELARRLGRGKADAGRILDPDHPTRLPTMQAALTALGLSVVVSVREIPGS